MKSNSQTVFKSNNKIAKRMLQPAPLRPGEVIIFKDGDPENCSAENLKRISLSGLARKFPRNGVMIQCPHCGQPFSIYLTHRFQRSSHNRPCDDPVAQKFEIEQAELSQLVWELPLPQIASLYGVSERAVAKRCRALGIIFPDSGYWIGWEQTYTTQDDSQ